MAGTASLIAVVALVLASVIFRPDRAIRVATGAVADAVCAKTFVSGLDPRAVFTESMDRPGIRRLRWLMRYRLDRARKTVDTSLLGLLGSRAAFHDGLGCVRLHGSREPYLLKSDFDALRTPKNPPLLPEIASPAIVGWMPDSNVATHSALPTSAAAGARCQIGR